MLTRRKFLKLGASTAVVLGTPHLFTNCKETTLPIETEKLNAQVAAVRGKNLTTMTQEVLEAIGGIQEIVREGEKVFIKPNMVTLPWGQYNNCFNLGECTKPEIIVVVIEECLKAGASEVIVGDGSQLYSFDWSYAITLDGSTDLVQEADRLSTKYDKNVTLACLENDSPGFVDIPSRTYLGSISIANMVTDADRVISIPVAKTHSWAQLTLALKNFVGVTSMKRYAAWVNDSHWDRGKVLDHSTPEAISQIFLDIVEAVKPDLSIIDFSIGVEGNGPTSGSGGTRVDMRDRLGSWLLLASTDIMAADATAARVMNHDVNQIKQLTLGYEMGLGEIGENSIEMLGENLDDIRVDWTPAILQPR
jgi:uncharacterized protein (DUF362 family)